MSEIKWIKVTTDLFDNRKIRQIEALPDGDAMIVIWIKILCLAGSLNDRGAIYVTPEIPYTDQTMAIQFNRPLTTVQMALNVFQSFGMIDIIDDIMLVSNWEKYQNCDGMEKIREQNRIRQRRKREIQKQIDLLDDASRDSHVTVTQCHATDKEEDKEEDIDKEKEKNIKEKRHRYGSYKNVLFTDSDLSKLKSEFPSDWEKRVENLSEYIASTGKSYKNHLATIRAWARRDKEKTYTNKPKGNKFHNFEQRDVDYDALIKKMNSIGGAV